MTRCLASAAAVLAAALFLLAPAPAHAHGLEPALLSLRETSPGRFAVVWQSSKIRLPGAVVRPILPDACRQTGDPPQAFDDGDRLRLQWVIDCGAGGLAGQAIGVADLDVATIDALLRVQLRGAAPLQTVLTARQPRWTAPVDPTPREVTRHYARLGATHLLGGVERLLLMLALVLLLAPAPRPLIQAVAAFALGHSLSLATVAVGLLAPPATAVDLGLGAGLLLLAVALTASAARRARLRRRGWLIGLAVGLLTGCTFAGALVDAGLPSLDAPLAVLAFNLGIAVAEIAALAVVLSAGALVARRLPRLPALATRGAAYVMGILATFWCLQGLAP